MVPENSFKWIHGEATISSYSKERGYMVNFCTRYGSPVPNRFRGYPLFSVPAGSLDGSPEIRVVVQINLGSKAEWDKECLDGQQCQEMPDINQMLELLHLSH